MIPVEQEQKVIYYYSHEKMRIGDIAKKLKLHRDTIRRVLARRGFQEETIKSLKVSMITSFVPFIREMIREHPKITSARLWRLCKDRGYQGGQDHFRAHVRYLRPERIKEAFLSLSTVPGEQSQVDWGHFGKIKVGRAQRRLSAFVMVLSWSRKIYLEFFYDQKLSSFLEAHNNAFKFFGGIPHVILYDNLKSVVLEREADIIKFNPYFLDYSNEAGFEARPVGIRKGNEKGKVERAIRYIRSSFFEAREFKDLADLNKQALEWSEENARERKNPSDPSLRISQAFAIEMKSLNPLPVSLPATDECFTARVKKTPYIHVDSNQYSVPYQLATKLVTVNLTSSKVKVLVNGEVMAEHIRSFDKNVIVEDINHIEALKKFKRKSGLDKTIEDLYSLLSNFREYISVVRDEGGNIGSETSAISRLVDSCGPEDVNSALGEALENGTWESGAVSLILDRNREKLFKEIRMPISFSDEFKFKDIKVKQHNPKNYDSLVIGGK